MKSVFAVLFCCISVLISGCAYKIDIRQGSYIEQKDVDKLRIDMSKEQVAFVLGKPVVNDAFNKNTWYYLYNVDFGDGRESRRIEVTLTFVDNRLKDLQGTLNKPEEFNQALD